MKKLLSLLLAFALACSMCLSPVVAAGGYVNDRSDEAFRAQVDGYKAEHPAEYAAFDPDAWLAQNRNCCYSSKEALMKGRDLADQAVFKDYMLADWLDYQAKAKADQAEIDAYAAAHPEDIAAFDVDAYLTEGYGWYEGGIQGYMRDMNIPTEDDLRREILLEWVRQVVLNEETQAKEDAWVAAHPDEVAAFDPDTWYEDGFWGSNGPGSKAEFMKYNDYTEEEFRQSMYYDWLSRRLYAQDRLDEWAALVAQEPERTAEFLSQFDVHFPVYAQYIYWDDDGLSPQEYMAVQGMFSMEELYLEVYRDWSSTREAAERAAAQRDAFITDHGGVPGTLNIMVNGAYLTFAPEALPYAAGGVTYVPASILGEALGVAVAGDARGFAPLRETAEAAGYTVNWDGEYHSAVLVSAAALADALDRQFTILNKTLSPYDSAKSYAVSGSLKVSYALLDSLHGDQKGALSGRVESRIQGTAAQSESSFDLSALADTPILGLIENYTLQNADYYSETAAREALKKVTFDSWTDGSGTALTRTSLRGLLASALADAWVETSVDGRPSVGGLVASQATPSWRYDWNLNARAWDNALLAAEPYLALLGDRCFTEDSTGWTYALDKAKVAAAMGGTSSGYYYGPTPDYSAFLDGVELKLHVDKNGVAVGSFRFAPDFATLQGRSGLVGSVLSMTAPWLDMDLSGTFSASAVNVSFHFKNTLKGTLTITRTVRETTAVPDAKPTEHVYTQDEYYEYLAGLI